MLRGQPFTQGIGPLGLTMKTTDFNFFIQDDWRITPRLTLNLGLRYEYQQNPDAVAPNPALPQTANKVNDKNNFGPRVGFAFDMTGDGKTSLRGGWGLYYGRVINSTVYSALTNTGLGPTVSQQQLTIAANNLPPTTSTCGGNPVTAQNCLPIYPNLLVPIGSTYNERRGAPGGPVLRRRLPVAANSPGRSHRRARDWSQHGRLGLVSVQLRKFAADLCRHELAAAGADRDA